MFRSFLIRSLNVKNLVSSAGTQCHNLVHNKCDNVIFDAMNTLPITDLEGDLSKTFLTLEKIDVNIFR